MTLVFVLAPTAAIGLYVATAPPPPAYNQRSKLEFHERSDIRRRPTRNSFPFARAQKGTRLEILGAEDDWVQVRVEGAISGWTERSQGVVIAPPPLRLTRRQRAKQQLQGVFSALRNIF